MFNKCRPTAARTVRQSAALSGCLAIRAAALSAVMRAGERPARTRRIFLAAGVKQKRGDVTERECYESGRKRLTAALKLGSTRCVVHNLLRPPPRLLRRGI